MFPICYSLITFSSPNKDYLNLNTFLRVGKATITEIERSALKNILQNGNTNVKTGLKEISCYPSLTISQSKVMLMISH
jgi:hypothetical protein